MTKEILIPFTGGLDSTFMIYDALHKNYNVKLFVTKLKNNVTQTASEDRAREKILSLFKDKKFCWSYDLNGNLDTNVMENSIKLSFNSRLILHQPPMWILTSLYCMRKYVNEIWFGYVGGDDALGFLEDIKEVYSKLGAFASSEFPELKFPLRRKFKHDLVNGLPDELLNVISWCERPLYDEEKDIYIECGECGSCIKMDKALTEAPDVDKDKYKKKRHEVEIDNSYSLGRKSWVMII